MACSFNLLHFILYVLIYTTLDLKCFAEKEYLFKKASVWSKKDRVRSVGATSIIGWIPGRDGAATSCDLGSNPNEEIENWFYLKKLKIAANRVFVEIDYEIQQKSCNASECGLFLQTYYDKVNFSSETIQPAFFTTKKISSSITPRTITRTFIDLEPGSNYVVIAVQTKGVCTIVYNMSVYYYYCPRNTSTSVVLERTAAPREGAPTPVKGYCSKHSSDSGSSMIAYCDVKGNWVDFKPQSNLCKCPTGTEFNKNASRCKPCKVDYFKISDEDGPCQPCPKNSFTNGLLGATSCVCLPDHYRRSINDECKSLPPKPKNLNYTVVSSDQIMLSWAMSRSDPSVRFRVKCEQRDIGSFKLVPCQHISLHENGANVAAMNITVNSLSANELYRFTVASLNDISSKVEERKWNAAFIKIKLPDQPKQDTTIPPKTETLGSTVVDPIDTTLPRTENNGGSTVSTIGGAGESKEDKQPSVSLGPMIGGAIGGLLLIVVIVTVVVYRSRRTKKEKLIEDVDLSTVDRSYIDPAKYGNPEKAVRVFAKEIDRRQVKLDGVIGEGEFAKVHRGLLCRPNEPQIEVAVKVLKPGSSAKNREDFLTEAAVMGQFKNLNIVALEGVVTISHPVMIITEFMHNGALSKFLVEKRTQLTEDTLLTMARGIASGMRYLSRMRFVHRDLAARNVLVNENLVCKVADFGLTRELEESCQGEYVTQGGKIPIRWTAPEAYKHRRFTTASDVWSFGVVLWEIMSYGDRPYGNWDNYMVMDQVNANYRLTPPTNCPKIVHQLMMECWKSDRTQRPAFSDIVEMLERWIKNPYLLKDYEYVTEKTRMADRKSCIAKSIREYLQGIKMERYIDNFIDFGYTELYQIQHFKDNDLVNIGVPLVGHRNKIIKGINPRGAERERLLPTSV